MNLDSTRCRRRVRNQTKIFMKPRWIPALILLACLLAAPRLRAQGTSFAYSGELSDAGGPANGVYDFRFILHHTPDFLG